MKKSEKLREKTLKKIETLIRKNVHLFPINEEKIEALHGDIHLNDGEEKILRIGETDIDTFFAKDLEEFSYAYEELTLEELEEIQMVIENAVVDFDNTMERCKS